MLSAAAPPPCVPGKINYKQSVLIKTTFREKRHTFAEIYRVLLLCHTISQRGDKKINVPTLHGRVAGGLKMILEREKKNIYSYNKSTDALLMR